MKERDETKKKREIGKQIDKRTQRRPKRGIAGRTEREREKQGKHRGQPKGEHNKFQQSSGEGMQFVGAGIHRNCGFVLCG